MDDHARIVLPSGDRLLAIARADTELRRLRLGISTVFSLMAVVAIAALFGFGDAGLVLWIALAGAGFSLGVDALAFRKVYALTDRHVVIRSRSDTQALPYERIDHVRRWITSLNLTVGKDVVCLEDLRDLAAWEGMVRERMEACRS